jgi:hypothetical protein
MYAATASSILKIGRQIDGFLTVMRPSRTAVLNMVLTIRSSRMRGLYPLTVPFRSEITENFESAS